MNLQIKTLLCVLNRQPSGIGGALYSGMSAAISRYPSLNSRGWVSTIRTPLLSIADSTDRVKFSSSLPRKPLESTTLFTVNLFSYVTST